MKKDPCSTCSQNAYCKKQEIACMQFYKYVTYGFFSTDTPKFPNIEIYDKIFNDDDLSITQIWERKEFV